MYVSITAASTKDGLYRLRGNSSRTIHSAADGRNQVCDHSWGTIGIGIGIGIAIAIAIDVGIIALPASILRRPIMHNFRLRLRLRSRC